MRNEDIVPGFYDVPRDGLEVSLSPVETLEQCIVVALDGFLDAGNADCFLGRLRKIIDAGFRWLVFDLHGLTYASSTGFRISIFLQAVKASAGGIVFMNVQPNVHGVLQLLGFSQVFSIKENLEDAVSHFVSRLNRVKIPGVLKCPICSVKAKVSRSGTFRCRHCGTVLAIDPAAEVFLG